MKNFKLVQRRLRNYFPQQSKRIKLSLEKGEEKIQLNREVPSLPESISEDSTNSEDSDKTSYASSTSHRSIFTVSLASTEEDATNETLADKENSSTGSDEKRVPPEEEKEEYKEENEEEEEEEK